MTELRQTPEYARYLSQVGWQIESSPAGQLAYLRKIPLTPFTVLKLQRFNLESLDLLWLKSITKKHRALVSYLEPNPPPGSNLNYPNWDADLRRAGYRPIRSGFVPSKTLRLNLKLTDQKLLKSFKPKTRYNLKLAQKHKLHFQQLTGPALLKNSPLFNRFIALLEANNRRVGYSGLNRTWFKAQLEAFAEKSLIILAYPKNGTNLLAAAVYLLTPDSIYYQHNGSTALSRKLRAPTLLVWEGIKAGQSRTCHWFDFDGIYDDREPLKRWRGFTRFKLGFGGKVLTYPPCYANWLPFL